jgi:hypothetical protein
VPLRIRTSKRLSKYVREIGLRKMLENVAAAGV